MMTSKAKLQVIIIIMMSFVLAYTVDQYYIAGRGFTFFFDILKL